MSIFVPTLLAVFSATSTYPGELVDVVDADSRLSADVLLSYSAEHAGQRLYTVGVCFVRVEVLPMLGRAQDWLDEHHPGYSLLLKDCYRPVAVQRRLETLLREEPSLPYAKRRGRDGNIYTYGASVDVSLLHNGAESDFGSRYYSFGPAAAPANERVLHARGGLSNAQLEARHILRLAMKRGGFLTHRLEWWAFDAWRGKALRERYRPVDIPLEVAAGLRPPLSK